MSSTKAIERARRTVERYCRRADRALMQLPINTAKRDLLAYTDVVANEWG
jgi:hypothetical protein